MSDIMHANNPTSNYMPEIDYTGQCQPSTAMHASDLAKRLEDIAASHGNPIVKLSNYLEEETIAGVCGIRLDSDGSVILSAS